MSERYSRSAYNINLQEKKMTTDGINGGGFEAAKPAGSSPWATENYTEAPKSAFPAADKSSQDGSGVGNGGK